uniref:ORF58a n=1 Tax=Pinus koraiensis TaxID=88728 RepID=A4QM31_PINKO|nr:ORF58a [Pinus koraiensis]ABP35358.1 ORF58a [Pinus koraiensis]
MHIPFLHSRVMKIPEKPLDVLYVPIVTWQKNLWILRFHSPCFPIPYLKQLLRSPMIRK